MAAMTLSRTEVARETRRRLRRLGLQNGEEIRRMRLDAGVSLGQLADVVGTHRSHLARIENNQVQPSLEVLIAIGLALGADLSVRYFSGVGPRLHDRFQAAMVEAFLRALDPRWSSALEVPVTQPSRGVIDLVLTDRASQVAVAVEVQSELRRLEQQIRWAAEKAGGLTNRLAAGDPNEAAREVSRLLILRSTVATREIARRYEATLATSYPARARDVVLALTTATAPWPGPGIIWMHIRGSKATLMPYPPPHVSLGR
jgi:transcriptional regulator with XRE-family HTH domain